MKKEHISPYVIKRLPRYYRFLGDLIDEGTVKISSKQLSERMKLTASQIRQDLNCFGEFGQQGYGYNVELLRNEIGDIIGITKLNRVVIIGAGNLGQAICDNLSFEKRGCRLVGIFDNNPDLYGEVVAGNQGISHKVQPMSDLSKLCKVKKNKPEIAVLCIPRDNASEVCGQLLELGVKNFWNFSHFDINVHFEDEEMNVENVHLGDSLLTLVYNLNRNKA
jgi:redox-sensing transcriptional repressor